MLVFVVSQCFVGSCDQTSKADQLPRSYGGTVDFDILGETWSREATWRDPQGLPIEVRSILEVFEGFRVPVFLTHGSKKP